MDESQELEKLERPRVASMEEILGKPFKILDDGFVRVIDYMGTDAAVVQAARVSYGAGTKKVHQDNVRDQTAPAGTDGLLAAVDPPSNRQR
jgi:hypothetical protein